MSSIIVKKQHVFPSRSIKRFCAEGGSVEVFRKASGKRFLAKPNNTVFWVNRVWDQSTEKSFGKRIEDEFQSVTEKILQRGCYEIPKDQHRVITRFLALWKYRAALDSEERLVNEASKLTSTVTELNEKNHLDELHVHYVDESGTFPARNIRGFELRGQVMMYERSYDNLNWCLVNSPHRDLIVPDTPEDDLFIPITPSMCLLTGQPVHELSLDQSIDANTRSFIKSKDIIFGRTVAEYA
ncbi:MAG: DUF4238 domain-containing protein [Colwellia sp.]|uniref:DUF4238 domain-containing protein n=1 Tax=Colwellia sp. TaxID=56799 RepID=UPI001D2CF226|nr:DUF4238 domain-containing protein [Colwellia sp.]NQY58183.1 DUF4238 domain-containing protein [Ilumatobacteraceae bacterium]NQZ25944.1 DUF4238 domain-containing protein [Colwellia sp.]